VKTERRLSGQLRGAVYAGYSPVSIKSRIYNGDLSTNGYRKFLAFSNGVLDSVGLFGIYRTLLINSFELTLHGVVSK
jgi:hypothetical protein